MKHTPCPFCAPPPDRVLYSGKEVLVLWDGYPVSPGHVLVVPRRHVTSWFETSAEEQKQIAEALRVAKEEIEREHKPDGYNVGINDGPAAGQTVSHVHVHLIPRYFGDVPDPRGGVRRLIPEKANYWDKAES